jgi:predicted lysophospholipase L1 biosynthesis ABC-type transport system permease subunit
MELWMLGMRVALFLAIASLISGPALADAPSANVMLKAHKFLPAEIHVKANRPNVIALTNSDDTAEEFDSTALKVEKVVAGHESGDVRLRPLAPGRYPFMGEFHSETAQGVVIAE